MENDTEILDTKILVKMLTAVPGVLPNLLPELLVISEPDTLLDCFKRITESVRKIEGGPEKHMIVKTISEEAKRLYEEDIAEGVREQINEAANILYFCVVVKCLSKEVFTNTKYLAKKLNNIPTNAPYEEAAYCISTDEKDALLGSNQQAHTTLLKILNPQISQTEDFLYAQEEQVFAKEIILKATNNALSLIQNRKKAWYTETTSDEAFYRKNIGINICRVIYNTEMFDTLFYIADHAMKKIERSQFNSNDIIDQYDSFKTCRRYHGDILERARKIDFLYSDHAWERSRVRTMVIAADSLGKFIKWPSANAVALLSDMITLQR